MRCKMNFFLFLMTLRIVDGYFESKHLEVKTWEADRQLRDVAVESCNKAFPERKNDLKRDGILYGFEMTYGGYLHLVFSCDIECKYNGVSGSLMTSFPEGQKCDRFGTRCKTYTEEKNRFVQLRRICLTDDFTLQLSYSLIKMCEKPKHEDWELMAADLTVNNSCRISCVNVNKRDPHNLVVLPRIVYRKPGTLCDINSICRSTGETTLNKIETVCKRATVPNTKMDPEAKKVCQGLLKYLSSEGRVHKELEGHSNFVIEMAEASKENECAVHCYMSIDNGPLKNVTAYKSEPDCDLFMKCTKTGKKSSYGIPIRKCQIYFLPSSGEEYRKRVENCFNTLKFHGVPIAAKAHRDNYCGTECTYYHSKEKNYTQWTYLKQYSICSNGTHVGTCEIKDYTPKFGELVFVTECTVPAKGILRTIFNGVHDLDMWVKNSVKRVY